MPAIAVFAREPAPTSIATGMLRRQAGEVGYSPSPRIGAGTTRPAGTGHAFDRRNDGIRGKTPYATTCRDMREVERGNDENAELLRAGKRRNIIFVPMTKRGARTTMGADSTMGDY